MEFLSVASVLLPVFLASQAAPSPALPDGRIIPHPQVVAVAAVESASLHDENLSDAYYQRLAVHRAASYAILPLFALQFAAGTQLFEKSSDAPSWAKVGHRVGATGVAALFATNLVTGIPNLIEARRQTTDRGRRTFHAVMMLAASAGFTATGLMAERAEGDPDARRQHRATAYTSMAVATVGYLSMLDIFRRD